MTLPLTLLLVAFTLFEPMWGDPVFTTRPKKREVFVGEDVQFDWGYLDDGGKVVKWISFGVRSEGKETTFVKKTVATDFLQWNAGAPARVDAMRERITVLNRSKTGRKASIILKDVHMNDTGTLFCKLIWDRVDKQPTATVDLKVVDLLINTGDSDSIKESWNGHRILVNCEVKVVAGVPVKFTWTRESDNKSFGKNHHTDKGPQSELTLITYDNKDYDNLICTAETPSTTQKHKIIIKQLYKPHPPQNLKEAKVFDKSKGHTVIHLFWEKPLNDGGSPIETYIVQYKPQGINWSQANEKETTGVKFNVLDLKFEKTYNVRVRARNKVGDSSASNVVDVRKDYRSSNAQSKALGVQLETFGEITLLTWWFVYSMFL